MISTIKFEFDFTRRLESSSYLNVPRPKPPPLDFISSEQGQKSSRYRCNSRRAVSKWNRWFPPITSRNCVWNCATICQFWWIFGTGTEGTCFEVWSRLQFGPCHATTLLRKRWICQRKNLFEGFARSGEAMDRGSCCRQVLRLPVRLVTSAHCSCGHQLDAGQPGFGVDPALLAFQFTRSQPSQLFRLGRSWKGKQPCSS